MKRTTSRLIVLSLILFANYSPALADSKIKVVTTIPDLADLGRRIGGDLVEVKSIATGVEDPHAVPMKPSFAVLLNRADVLLLQGLALEHAFLPGLLDAARNPKIMPGSPGYIDCSKYVLPRETPTKIDRSLGEQHPQGNPHFNLDPGFGKSIAKAITEGLTANYPEHASTFKRNFETFSAELDRRLAQWEKEGAPLKGVKFVSYHPDMLYFAERFGMEPVGTIELRAGVDPTPSHIADLEALMQREKVRLVIREKHYPAQLAKTIAETTGSQLAETIVMVNGAAEAKDYFSFVDYNLHSLLNAVKGRN